MDGDSVETKRLPSAQRRAKVEASFRNKLAELYRILRKKRRNPRAFLGRPKMTLEDFRAWTVDGKFHAWTSQSIDAPGGPHKTLAKKLRKALDEINEDPFAALERENADLKERIEVLTAQNVQLEAKVRRLVDECTLAGGLPMRKRADVLSLYRK